MHSPSWWGGTVAGTGGSISPVVRKQTETNDVARLPFFLLIPEPQPMSDATTVREWHHHRSWVTSLQTMFDTTAHEWHHHSLWVTTSLQTMIDATKAHEWCHHSLWVTPLQPMSDVTTAHEWHHQAHEWRHHSPWMMSPQSMSDVTTAHEWCHRI